MKHNPLNEEATALGCARIHLPAMLKSYFEHGRKLAGCSPSPAVLHKFRLETKALRYTLELFQPCFGPGLERFLVHMRSIQDCLGALNDYVTTKRLIAGRSPRGSPERLKIERLLAARIRRKSSEFKRYWRLTLDRSGEEQHWTAYFSRDNRKPRAGRLSER